jgi:iron complex outermembrane receptor protein
MRIMRTSRLWLLQSLSASALFWGGTTGSQAADAKDDPAASSDAAPPIRNNDDIVVTAARVNAETPITASVHTTEPQAIVSRSIIENSVPPTADISDVVLLTPGASGTSSGNGPGLSESKTVLRGFQDGQFNITYDGIPFGDSNDPTHHSTAYFPDGTYERIIVDRGPGSATDLGQSSYGGNIHIISREAARNFGVEAQGVYGSYKTYLGRLTVNSGAIDSLGGLRIIAVGEYKDTRGALTNSKAWFANGFVKAELPLGDNARFSILSSYNQDQYNQSDNNGVTCTGAIPAGGETDGANCLPSSQVGLYGKGFGLVDVNDPRFAGTLYPSSRFDWNWTNKTTDFEIARLQINFSDAISFDNKLYTFFYKNFTVSTETSTQACTGGIATATTCGGMSIVNSSGKAVPGDIPGYTKVNQYRNWGDVAQVDVRTSIGIAKVGIWYESSSSHRYRYDYDFTKASAGGAFADGFFDFAAMTNFYNYREKDKPFNLMLNGAPVPLYIKYDERTGWQQVQGYGEFEFKLLDDRLTVTPGVKVQNFTREIVTPIASQSARVGIVAHDSYRPTLPYFTVNYLIRPDLSIYAQFAKGFLVPSLGNSLEGQIPGVGGTACAPGVTCNLQPTKTTNYQAGIVYAGDRLNVDADVYYITASNSTFVDPSSGIATQSTGAATYQGVEAQASYVFIPGLTAIVNGSLNSAKDDTSKMWLAQAPNYTALAGVVYNSGRLKLSYLHKFTGRQYADTAQAIRIAPFSTGIAAATAFWGPVGVGLAVYNVFNDRSTTKIGGPTSGTPAYFFQPGRSYQAQLKLRF